MYQALYRKYRPSSFEDVVGQKVIIKTLTNSILNNKISHAYLFAGPRGTGKTSIAKILAKIVNCENLNGVDACNNCVNCTQTNNRQNTDIIEIDAASNNGVDEIRELRDKVNLVPSFGKYKVYIIDEVHMLTTAAFNALLKTLEEPPKHIIFILATTEPHKIPLTILSRCQRYDFKKIGINDIVNRLNQICIKENIEISKEALNLIATLSDGGLRDSIGLLDQLTAYTSSKIGVDDVHDIYGTITDNEIYELLQEIYKKNLNQTFDLIEKYDEQGKNLNKIIELTIEFLKNSLIYLNSQTYFENKEQVLNYSKLCELINEDKIYETIQILLDLLKSSKNAINIKLLFELAVIRILYIKKNNKQELKEIPIIEPSKKIIENKKEPKIEAVSDDIKGKLEQLKTIRINNTLSKFNKKELLSFKKQMEDIKINLMDPDYSALTSLILDGELKAKGNEYLIFVYKVKKIEEYFNYSLIKIEQILEKTYNINYKPIAVTEEEWEKIKVEFNKNIKLKTNKYEYREETESLESIFNKKEEICQSKNEIESTFDDILVYEN